MASSCERCNGSIGIGRLTGRRFCKTCDTTINEAVAGFLNRAVPGLSNGEPPVGPSWIGMITSLQRDGIPADRIAKALKPYAMDFLRRVVASSFADGIITQAELETFDLYALNVGLHADHDVAGLRDRMRRGLMLADIGVGNLPVIDIMDIYLDTDEKAHLAAGAQYVRHLKSGTKVAHGRLLATNKKLRFLGADIAWELTWNKVLSVSLHSPHELHLQASQAKGTGMYLLHDAEYVSVVIDTIARIHRREILGAPGQRDTPKIPQHVKAEVWRRDQGKCVECGANSYLEFDHIIPRSKGGASSIGNLQLLCRACNGTKRDRI